MSKDIKYTYISKNKSTDAVLSNLTHSLKTFNGFIEGYKILDNTEHGIRVYPEIVQDNVEICSKNEIINKIETSIEEGAELILLNAFEIDLDEIKNTYAKIADESGIMLCINCLYDVKESVTVTIDSSIHKLDENDWEILKQDIEESILDAVEEYNDEDFDILKRIKPSPLTDKSDSFEDVLKKIFDPNIDKSNRLDAITPEVIYSQVLQDKELHITKTINGDIVIDNEIEMITIEKDQLDFFLNTISLLIK